MTHDEQMSAGRDRLGQASDHVDHPAVRRVQEVGGDEVEGASSRREGPGIDLPPVDPVGDPCIGGVLGGPSQPVRGEVGTGDLPPLLSQPDDIAALTAADVECVPWEQPAHLGHELGVGVAAPDLLGTGVALLPAPWSNISAIGPVGGCASW